MLPFSWNTIASKKAPEGRWVAYHLKSTSEAGEAPYGDHIVLASRNSLLGQYFGEVVFAAYCEGGLEFRWIDKQHLRIDCKSDKVMKKLDTYKRVHIQYQIVGEKPRH